MRSRLPLLATIPDNLFPLTVTVQEQSAERDPFSGQRVATYTDLLTAKCFVTTGARGAVRDQELRKDDRDHVKIQGLMVINMNVDVPHGARLKVEFPVGLGNKVEYWRVVGVEHRPLSAYTRCAIEQFDGSVRR